MLKTRIIPTLLWKDLSLVKGKGFDSWRPIGTILPAIKVYNTRDVDELMLVNITATPDHHDLDYDEIESLTSECFIPMTIGGGIKTIQQIQKLLRCGADKVLINSSAYENPQLIKEASEKFGNQCLVIGIDFKRSENNIQCVSHCGKKNQNQDPVTWAKKMEQCGAGEILLTSVDRDGTMSGYDLDVIEKVSQAVSIPVIASGGAANYDDMLKAIHHGATAVSAASLFHFTEQTPQEAKEYLAQNGVAIRKRKV